MFGGLTNGLNREYEAKNLLGCSDEESEEEVVGNEAIVGSRAEAVTNESLGLCTGCGKEVNQAGAWYCKVSAQK
jgi:hypothetical protein